jgi:hypothetical protein
MDKDTVHERLRGLLVRVPAIKARGVAHRDTPEFKEWNNSLKKWLSLGSDQCSREAEVVDPLHFFCLRIKTRPGYDQTDEEYYQMDLDTVSVQLASAIENIELSLPMKPPESQPTPAKASDKITIIAQSATFGDNNHVTVSNTLTLASVLEVVEREIAQKVEKPEERGRLLKALKEFTSNPTVTAILNQALPSVLKHYGGG